MGQAQVSRLESGPPVLHLDRLIQWARALRIPAEYLWFKLPEDDQAPSGGEDVNRRRLLASTGVAVAGALAPLPTSGSLAIPHRTTAVATTDLAAVMLTPSAVDRADGPPSVARLHSEAVTAWRLRQRANYEALARLLPRLIIQSERSAETAADAAEQERARRITVHGYNAASSLLKTLGDAPLAMLAADRAVRWARSVGDPVLVAAATYRLANVLLATRRLDEARTVALQAADLVEPGMSQSSRSLAVSGGLLLTAAVAAARRGDASVAWELMGQARTASRLLRSDHADLYSIFGPTNVAIHNVQVAVELRDGRAAVQRSQHVDPDRLPASLIERRGQFLIDVAHAHVLDGDDTAAVATLVRADRVAGQEVRLSRQVPDLIRTLLARERISATPGLRALARDLDLPQ
jgi:hypothetical protein